MEVLISLNLKEIDDLGIPLPPPDQIASLPVFYK